MLGFILMPRSSETDSYAKGSFLALLEQILSGAAGGGGGCTLEQGSYHLVRLYYQAFYWVLVTRFHLSYFNN